METNMSYCGWDSADELDRKYHDTEWGIPVHDDRQMFEHFPKARPYFISGMSWEKSL